MGIEGLGEIPEDAKKEFDSDGNFVEQPEGTVTEDTETAYDKIFKDESGSPIETAGTWENVYRTLGFKGLDELEDFVKGKEVLDSGSGGGGFAKETYLRNINAHVVSLNPRLAIPGMNRQNHEIMEQSVNELLSERDKDNYEDEEEPYEWNPGLKAAEAFDALTQGNYEEVNRVHDESAVAGLSDKLPFKPDSFDVIIDNKGATYHTLYMDQFDPDTGVLWHEFKPNRQVLANTLKEYKRVVRPGGKVRIGGFNDEVEEGYEFFKEVCESLGIEYEEFEEETETETENGTVVERSVVAVEIII